MTGCIDAAPTARYIVCVGHDVRYGTIARRRWTATARLQGGSTTGLDIPADPIDPFTHGLRLRDAHRDHQGGVHFNRRRGVTLNRP